MLDNNTLIKKSRYVLTIGDEGAILAKYAKNGKLEARLFAENLASPEIRHFKTLLERDMKAPIAILLDVMDQAYVQQNLPGVSQFAINGLINSRLKRDIPDDNLKGVLKLGRLKSGRKDWSVLFVSSPMTQILTDWVDFVLSYPNKFDGIFMVPLEVGALVNDLCSRTAGGKKKKGKNTNDTLWKLFVAYNKVGGVRQVVTRKGKTIFTRMINLGAERQPEIIGGNIAQEVNNTIEYLRRLGYSDEEGLEVVTVTSKDIKNTLEDTQIEASNRILLTPFQLAERLKLNNAATPEDQFADMVISSYLATNRKFVLKFNTPVTKKLDDLFVQESLVKSLGIASVIGLALFTLYQVKITYDTKQALDFSLKNMIEIERQWKKKQAERIGPGLSIDEAEKITDLVELYRLIIENKRNPLIVISEFLSSKGLRVIVRSMDWEAPFVDQSSQKVTTGSEAQIDFDIDLYNQGGSFEKLFSLYNELGAAMNKQFDEKYLIEISQLPVTFGLNTSQNVIPIKISLSEKSENLQSNANRGN